MKYLKDAVGLTTFSDQEILNALGLFEMFGVGLQNGARAIFPTLLSFQHKCCPNTYMTFLPDGRLVVRASVQVKKGELVTRSLVEVMQCTPLRRIELERSFLIDCRCSRCCDPTEMGTGLGGICCPDFPGKVFLPTKPIEKVRGWSGRGAREHDGHRVHPQLTRGVGRPPQKWTGDVGSEAAACVLLGL